MIVCILCFQKKYNTRQQASLCQKCLKKLVPISNEEQSRINSLFLYEPHIRQLILEVKIRGSYPALFCLTELLVNSKSVQYLIEAVDYIMPAPSSLWSRFYGRFDLAYLLCYYLAKAYKKQLLCPPLSLMWRWQKRSQCKERLAKEFFASIHQNQMHSHLLIFDDVFTTGYTLKKVADLLTDTYNLHFLTLAKARC